MLRGRRRKSAISMYRHRRGPVWSPKGSLALILPSIAGPLLLDLHRNFNMELRCSFVVYLWN